MARNRHPVAPTPPLSEIVSSPKAVREIAAQAQDFDNRISQQEVAWTLGFLKYFGYLNGKKRSALHFPDFRDAIKLYQRSAGLNPHGELDQRTANAMQAPRCGVCDVEPLRMQLKLTAGEALPLGQPKWNKSAITYAIDRYLTGIPTSVQDDIIATSYKHWSSVCGLKISRSKDTRKADIVISTGRGPRNQFDGPGNTLAWAYLPPGDDRQLLLMYDEDESWTARPTGAAREILLENVTTHEGGHTLGLEHSTVQQALMAPYYAVNVNAPVSPDDVERIQKLYGQPTASPVPSPSIPASGTFSVNITGSGRVDSVSIPGFRVTKLAAVKAPARKQKK